MASFVFDKYIQAVGYTLSTPAVIPVSPSAHLGICLISGRDGDTAYTEDLDKDDDFDGTGPKAKSIASRIAIDEQDGAKAIVAFDMSKVKFVPVPTDYEQEPPVQGYTMIKSHSIKFGASPNNTTIKHVVGAVVFTSTEAGLTNPTDENAIPVCYLDFGGEVDSSAGPFKVVFKGGIPDQEDNPTESIDPDNPVYTDLYKEYGTVFLMR